VPPRPDRPPPPAAWSRGAASGRASGRVVTLRARGAQLAVDRVELIEGAGRTLWPRPGRVFAAARSHTFAALADAIDTAFARWDRAHLHLFELDHDVRPVV
jgi:hypothetical protein